MATTTTPESSEALPAGPLQQDEQESPIPPPVVPAPTVEQILQCQFSSWYDTFCHLSSDDDDDGEHHDNCASTTRRRRRRSNVTIKSVVLSLPSEFVDYLLSDGVRLPRGATRVSSYAPDEIQNDNDEQEEDGWSSHSDDEEEVVVKKDTDNDNSSDEPELQQYHFPELNQQIEDAIEALGGAVVPKLNWSSPKDATWVNNGTLQCQTAGDVYLLLKSSDFVLHDVMHAMEDVQKEQEEEEGANGGGGSGVSYELVLRKWCNLHPSMEFRCFVWNRVLIAISQRNHTQHFAHLVRDRIVLRSQLLEFFDTTLRERFPSPSYCFDVYIDKKDRVWLLDFNVWARQTDALLYTWEELMSMTTCNDAAMMDGSAECAMRVVETELEIHQDPLASYRAPIDTIDLASSENFDEFMALCERPSERD